MGHQSWTASCIGDPVIAVSRPESETTKCTRLLWPTRRMEATTPNADKSNGLRWKASLPSTMFDVILRARSNVKGPETKMGLHNGGWWFDLVLPKSEDP